MEQYSNMESLLRPTLAYKFLPKTPHYFDAKNSFWIFFVSRLNANIFHIQMPVTAYKYYKMHRMKISTRNSNQVIEFSLRFISLQSTMLFTCDNDTDSYRHLHYYGLWKWPATNENWNKFHSMSLYCCYQIIILNYFKWIFFALSPPGPPMSSFVGGKIDITSFCPQTKIHSVFSSGSLHWAGFSRVQFANDLKRTIAVANKYFFINYATHTTMTIIIWLNDLQLTL